MTERVLNLYSGLGGNRKYWQDVEVVAIEKDPSFAKVYSDYFPEDEVIVADAHEFLLDHFDDGWDYIWSSPPCPTHSRMANMTWKDDSPQNKTRRPRYPDMRLYQEIILLDRFYNGDWTVENVISYYEPLIEPKIVGRHYIWSNFSIRRGDFDPSEINDGKRSKKWEEMYGFDLDGYDLNQRRDKVIKNCVDPELGEHIMSERRNEQTAASEVDW